MINQSRIEYLLQRWIDGHINLEEEQELATALNTTDIQPLLVKYIDRQVNEISQTSQEQERVLSAILQLDKREPLPKMAHRVHFLKTAWVRYAAAILIIFGIASYLVITKQPVKKPVIAETQNKEPGTDKAILTLSDGRTITLDKSGSEKISDGKISIEKTNGTLTYNLALTSENSVVSYNTMATPRGGQYQLILPDGSKVWLNSASTIKYPTVFNGKNRTVELSGEAYFDIKANKKMPFIVKTQKAEVLVLGTEFNVNSFEDEPDFSTTLISGSVKVSANDQSKIITPGQQAKLSNDQYNTLTVHNVDINQAIAWQKGIFRFEGAPLEVIARQLVRWYDVKVIIGKYNKAIELSGGIAKKTPLRTVLKSLEANGINYKWENDVITLYSN